MVELEFMVGKVHVAMKIARIKLNVVSCYALTEAGWETILGSAHQSALVNEKTHFHAGCNVRCDGRLLRARARRHCLS